MKKYLFRSLTLTFLLVSSVTFSLPRVIIENASLIDAASPLRENMTVVLQGDVIESVKESSFKIINIKKKRYRYRRKREIFNSRSLGCPCTSYFYP